MLGCHPGDLIFCSGATEANNTVVAHFARTSAEEAWVSSVEHPSVLEALREWFPGRFRLVPVDRGGRVEVGWLEEELRKRRPAFVGVMAVNNETGVIQPWREVQAVCERAGVPFFCDGVQAFGKDASVSGGLPDYMVGCAHKFGGPNGVGFLKLGRGFRGLLRGGAQEEGRRAGTENVAGVLAMAAALRDRVERVRTPGFIRDRLRWRAGFERRLLDALPGLRVVGGLGGGGEAEAAGRGESQEGACGGTGVWPMGSCPDSGDGEGESGWGRFFRTQAGVENGCGGADLGGLAGGSDVGRIWNSSLVILPEVDCRQRWVVKLDRLGVAVSSGSACATGKEQVSHVLTSMGYSDRDASRAVRVSSGWEHCERDWIELGDVFLEAARMLGVLN
jgi:cysteine sulfinate desulfinase/cysteine desulfurase-like protein